jgi:hypothetical protein
VRLAPASNVVSGSSFHPVGVAAAAFVASGDYVLFSTAVGYGSNPAWIVINDMLGTRTALDPQCDVLGLGPPWVLMICPSTSTPAGPDDIELYSLTNGTQQTVTPVPGVPYCPFGPGDMETECATPAAVGADWIRWNATCYNCAVTFYFENIQTGEVLDDPTNATTYAGSPHCKLGRFSQSPPDLGSENLPAICPRLNWQVVAVCDSPDPGLAGTIASCDVGGSTT